MSSVSIRTLRASHECIIIVILSVVQIHERVELCTVVVGEFPVRFTPFFLQRTATTHLSGGCPHVSPAKCVSQGDSSLSLKS